jgi:cytochrome c556
VESDDDDRVVGSRRKRRRTDTEDLNQVRKALAEAREKHAALQQQQIERDAQTAEEYAEARTQLQTYIQANETLQKELSNMTGRERELKEVQERLQDVERREAELLGDAARREAELRATIDKLKAQMADLKRQCAEGQSRGDNAKGQNREGSSNGVFDLTADGTNTLLGSNDVPRTPDVNSEPGESDLARDAPQTPASNASPDDSDPSRDAADHRCISRLQCIPGWSKDPGSTDLTAHVDVNGTWDEV